MIESFKVKLDIPYNDLPKVKSLGAKSHYDKEVFKCWYVPPGLDLLPFKNWWSGKYRHRINLENNHAHSLTDYLKYIKNIMEDSLSAGEWIMANINDLSGGAHKYLGLSDYDQSGNETSKARAIIFSKNKFLLTKFKQQTGFDLSANHKVMLKVTPDFTERYGMSLVVTDIYPEFTIGDMEAKIKKMRDQLISEGIYSNNKNLKMPIDFHNVAVIAPENAAGLGDFKTISDKIQDLDTCNFDFFSAVFQGANVKPSFNVAFGQFLKSNEIKKYDCLCIIRGGGDKAGLYALNEYELAKLILSSPIPVITGIGHERDKTFLDEISNTSLPTPSMVINYIKDTIISFADLASYTVNDISLSVDKIIQNEERHVASLMQSIDMDLSVYIEIFNNKLKSINQDISSNIDYSIANFSGNLDNVYRSISESMDFFIEKSNENREKTYQYIMMNNPAAVLNRGYLVMKQGDNLIHSSKDLKEGRVRLFMKDSKVDMRISEINIDTL